MFKAGHDARRWIAKIFLSAICCSLLTVQSSYRYYQYANARHAALCSPAALFSPPAVTGIAGAWQHGRAESARAGLSFRCLDKRFELEPLFLLPAPLPSSAPRVKATTTRRLYFAAVLTDRSHPNLCLRGPPPICC